MRKLYLLAFLFVGLLAVPPPASAQFGKNQVIWEKTTWNFYQSAHFDFYFSLDIKDEDAQRHFSQLVAHCEGSYEYLSVTLGHELKRRPIVVVSRTHSTFEALHLAGEGFMPEGVGAYALPRGSRLLPNSDLILAVKPDFLPVLNRTIYTHELVHIFQFDMIGWSFLRRSGDGGGVDPWIYEATADYLANLYAPYSRDDIRRMTQRVAAANVKNPQTGLPTLELLQYGYANPYAEGAMVFMFLEAKFGREAVMQVITDVFKSRKQRFMDIVADLSQGELSTPEQFDRAHRDYWAGQYAKDSLERAKPYQETDSFKGRQLLKRQYPYPLTSPAVSSDGELVAFLTMSPKNGIVLAIARALPRENPEYVPSDKRKKYFVFGQRVPVSAPPLKILTTFMPPKHYEYIVAQELNVWPFNGSDLDWWQDPQWVKERQALKDAIKAQEAAISEKKEKDKKADVTVDNLQLEQKRMALAGLSKKPGVSKAAFFARRNRDHALFIIDVNTGDFLMERELKDLDQAFSPNFSSDGTFVYFSAAKNIQRDLYAWNLELDNVTNLTNGGVFNSAPAVSPDNSKIAYVAFVGGYQKLFLLDLVTMTKTQLTYGRWNDNSPDWSEDGTILAFTSDEKDGIWNLYTFDLGTGTTNQWTDFFGGVFTPKFMPGEKDRVVYTAYLEEDQWHSFVYPNFELFDATLKNPSRAFVAKDGGENMELAFRSQESVTEQLDQRQLEKPQDPPSRWKFYGSNVYFGSSTYWGTFAFTRVAFQDILANRTHSAFYAQSGSFKYMDYTYLDQSQRWAWATNVSYTQYPIYYTLYSIGGKRPKYPEPYGDYDQYVLNTTWARESSATFFTQYPFSKWDRVELGTRLRKRSYVPLFETDPNTPSNGVTDIDVQFADFFRKSEGTSVGLTAAFVHDTVLYSYDTLGPLHGNALRVQTEFAPGLSGTPTSMTAYVDARKYMRLTAGSLFAVRAGGLYSTRPNGDFMLLGGDDTLRTYPYYSVAGNRVAYGSAELRFPVARVLLFDTIPFTLRGFLFGDVARTQFSDDRFAGRDEYSYGFGLQTWLFLPMNFEWARTKFEPEKWRFNFRIGLNF